MTIRSVLPRVALSLLVAGTSVACGSADRAPLDEDVDQLAQAQSAAPLFTLDAAIAGHPEIATIEIALYESANGPMVDGDSTTMPTMTWVGRRADNTEYAAFTLDQTLWTKLATLRAAAGDPYAPNNTPAVDAAVAALAGAMQALTPAQQELLEVVADNHDLIHLVVAGGPCAEDYAEFVENWTAIMNSLLDLLKKLHKAPVCKSPEPASKIACAGLYVLVGTAILTHPLTMPPKILHQWHATAAVAHAASIHIGHTLDVPPAQSIRESVVREAKETYATALEWDLIMEVDMVLLSYVAMVWAAQFPPDLDPDDDDDDEYGDDADDAQEFQELIEAFYNAFEASVLCAKRVIQPRYENAALGVRLGYVNDQGQMTWLGEPRTALRRSVATQTEITIDVEALAAAHPGTVSGFDQDTQWQSFSLWSCEGLMIDHDPQPLSVLFYGTLQQAHTLYTMHSSPGGGPNLLADYTNGIALGHTEIVKAFATATMHRGCDGDDDNDGRPDPMQLCHYDDPLDQDGEEDLYGVGFTAPVHGKTTWTPVDYNCIPIGVNLVSDDGFEGPVQQLVIQDVGSPWTLLDGTIEDGHAQDSTQIRYRLIDSNWGRPLDRSCHVFDAMEQQWQCDDTLPGCAAVCPPPEEPQPGGGGGMGPP